jgi:ubiquinone/menaquinone biosynthesis C-methylase UbiE
MNKPMSSLAFRGMSLFIRLRDRLSPPENTLNEIDIEPGFHILDYGCGPGGYSIAVAESVGQSGKVYALDIHPLAVQRVQNVASKRGLTNLQTIHSDCATGLSDESIDVVLLYDILHMLNSLDQVLAELHRVLKPNGVLSCNDHHMMEEQILSKMTNAGLFRLAQKGNRTYNFSKGDGNGAQISGV